MPCFVAAATLKLPPSQIKLGKCLILVTLTFSSENLSISLRFFSKQGFSPMLPELRRELTWRTSASPRCAVMAQSLSAAEGCRRSAGALSDLQKGCENEPRLKFLQYFLEIVGKICPNFIYFSAKVRQFWQSSAISRNSCKIP